MIALIKATERARAKKIILWKNNPIWIIDSLTNMAEKNQKNTLLGFSDLVVTWLLYLLICLQINKITCPNDESRYDHDTFSPDASTQHNREDNCVTKDYHHQRKEKAE